jgi:hypothetical protein
VSQAGNADDVIRIGDPALGGAVWKSLFQLAADLGELLGDVDTQGIDQSDDGKRDGGCDQAIFDRGSAGFIS